MITISTPPDTAFFDMRVELDGTPYILDFAWNARGGERGTWLLSVSTPDGVPLVSGVTIVSNRLLLDRYKYDVRMPAGDIMAYDATATIPAPGYADFGSRVDLIYVEAEDL